MPSSPLAPTASISGLGCLLKNLKDRLVYSNGDNLSVGWGIHIVEGPNWLVLTCTFILMLGASGIAAVVQSVTKGGCTRRVGDWGLSGKRPDGNYDDLFFFLVAAKVTPQNATMSFSYPNPCRDFLISHDTPSCQADESSCAYRNPHLSCSWNMIRSCKKAKT